MRCRGGFVALTSLERDGTLEEDGPLLTEDGSRRSTKGGVSMTFDLLGRPSSRRTFLKGAGVVSAAALAGFPMPAIAQAQDINIISAESNADALAVLRKIADDFGKQAGVKVVVNNMDHEAHKTAIRNYLVAGAPDVCFWFSGNRMQAFVKRGLFDDISDLFEKEKYKDVLGAATGAVTVDGKQYGLPTGGTLWGMFYRKDVFSRARPDRCRRPGTISWPSAHKCKAPA